MPTLTQLKQELRAVSDKRYVENLTRFFKTGLGEYGEGDIFIGIRMPDLRRICKKYRNSSVPDIGKLMDEKYHEFRIAGVVLMADKFKRGDGALRTEIKNLYEEKMDRVNNWDLVDLSAHKIYGEWFRVNDKNPMPTLRQLAKSKNMWRRRIAVVSTFAYLPHGQFSHALEIAGMLLNDNHDLIHKAVGWALREVGKRDLPSEERFLLKHYKTMPRTMLRYAIEKFPEVKRQKYLRGLM